MEASQRTPAEVWLPPPGKEDEISIRMLYNAAELAMHLNTVFTISADTYAAFAAIGAYNRINGHRWLLEYQWMPLSFWTNEVLLSAVSAQVLYSAIKQGPPQDPPHAVQR